MKSERQDTGGGEIEKTLVKKIKIDWCDLTVDKNENRKKTESRMLISQHTG